jgi:hypothetical protein
LVATWHSAQPLLEQIDMSMQPAPVSEPSAGWRGHEHRIDGPVGRTTSTGDTQSVRTPPLRQPRASPGHRALCQPARRLGRPPFHRPRAPAGARASRGFTALLSCAERSLGHNAPRPACRQERARARAPSPERSPRACPGQRSRTAACGRKRSCDFRPVIAFGGLCGVANPLVRSGDALSVEAIVSADALAARQGGFRSRARDARGDIRSRSRE